MGVNNSLRLHRRLCLFFVPFAFALVWFPLQEKPANAQLVFAAKMSFDLLLPLAKKAWKSFDNKAKMQLKLNKIANKTLHSLSNKNKKKQHQNDDPLTAAEMQNMLTKLSKELLKNIKKLFEEQEYKDSLLHFQMALGCQKAKRFSCAMENLNHAWSRAMMGRNESKAPQRQKWDMLLLKIGTYWKIAFHQHKENPQIQTWSSVISDIDPFFASMASDWLQESKKTWIHTKIEPYGAFFKRYKCLVSVQTPFLQIKHVELSDQKEQISCKNDFQKLHKIRTESSQRINKMLYLITDASNTRKGRWYREYRSEVCRRLKSTYHDEFSDEKKEECGLWNACDQGVTRACSRLVLLRYVETENKQEAQKSFGMLCQKGDGLACLAVGFFLEEGTEQGGVDKAAPFYQQSCALKNRMGCRRLALSYRALDSMSDFATKNFAFERACELGDVFSCRKLAEFYSFPDAKRVFFYQKACRLKHARSCLDAGRFYLKMARLRFEKEKTQALRLYTTACDLDKKTCEKLKRLIKTRNVPKDAADKD